MQRRKSEKRIPIIRDKNFTEFYPDAKQWVKRITKVVLNHLDGTTSEIKLEFPIYSFWSEPQEKSNYYLSAWINDLSRHWIKIASYEVFLGSINDKGEESYSICYGIDEIPLNKVWVPAKEAGEWMKPEDVKRDPRTTVDRSTHKFLQPYDLDLENLREWTFDELVELAFDSSLADTEAAEFQKAICEAKELERKGNDLNAIRFYACYISGILLWHYNK